MMAQFVASRDGVLTNLTQPVSQYCSAWIDVSTRYCDNELRVVLYAHAVASPFVHTDVQLTFARCSPAMMESSAGQCSGHGRCAVNMSHPGVGAGYCACYAGFSGEQCEHRACAIPSCVLTSQHATLRSPAPRARRFRRTLHRFDARRRVLGWHDIRYISSAAWIRDGDNVHVDNPSRSGVPRVPCVGPVQFLSRLACRLFGDCFFQHERT